MKLIYRLFLVMVAAWCVAACGSSDDFVVRGQLEGIDAQMVTLTYFDRGGLQTINAQSLSGKFSLRGVASRPSLGVLTLSDGTWLATLIVQNGEEINVEVNPDNPYAAKVSGSGASQEIGRWLNDNADALMKRDAAAVNAAVSKYVTSNPGRLSSTAILVSYFNCEGNEAAADSLFSLLTPQARPSEVVQGFNSVITAQLADAAHAPLQMMSLYELCDSLILFTPARASMSLLCFTTDDRAQLDSVRGHLRRLSREHQRKQLQLAELNTAPDSATWRRSFGGDTTGRFYRTWLPGSVAAPAVRKLAIPRMPYFVVVDSTGAQLYRGASIIAAESVINTRL